MPLVPRLHPFVPLFSGLVWKEKGDREPTMARPHNYPLSPLFFPSRVQQKEMGAYAEAGPSPGHTRHGGLKTGRAVKRKRTEKIRRPRWHAKRHTRALSQLFFFSPLPFVTIFHLGFVPSLLLRRFSHLPRRGPARPCPYFCFGASCALFLPPGRAMSLHSFEPRYFLPHRDKQGPCWRARRRKTHPHHTRTHSFLEPRNQPRKISSRFFPGSVCAQSRSLVRCALARGAGALLGGGDAAP